MFPNRDGEFNTNVSNKAKFYIKEKKLKYK